MEPRPLPHNLEAEQSVLEAILRDNATLSIARLLIHPRDFFREGNQIIFDYMIAMGDRGAQIDEITLCEELDKAGQLERAGGKVDVYSIVSGHALYRDASDYITGHARLIAAHSKRRRFIFEAGQSLDWAYSKEPAEDIAGKFRAALDALETGASNTEPPDHLLSAEVTKQRAQREARRIVEAELHGASTAVVQPNPLPLDQLLAVQWPALEFAIEQLQPRGAKVLLAAQAKAGKTTTVINAIRSLVDGEPFLNTFRVQPREGRVCLLDLEMTERQLHWWFSQANIRNQSRVTVQQLRGKVSSFNIMDRVVRAEWAAKLRELEVSYLVFDNLRPLLDALGLDEKSDAGRFLVAFDSLVAEAGISESMIVHHMGHNGNRSRGDSRLRDWPDVEWFLTRDKDSSTGEVEEPSGPRYFKAYGRDVDFPMSQLAFDETARRLTVIGGSPTQLKSDAALVAIYELLADGPLAKATIEGRAAGHPRKALREATDRGIVEGVLCVAIGARGAQLISRGPASPPVRRSSPPARQFGSSPLAAPIGARRAGDYGDSESSSPLAEGGTHGTYSI